MNEAIDRIASRQHCLITSRQLGTLGHSRRQVAAYRRKGSLLATPYLSVHRLPGGPVTWIQTVHAAVLAAGPDAFISHATAAVLWALLHVCRDYAGMHVTARHVVRIPGITAHTISLGEHDTTVTQWVPITTPERTLMDLAGTLSIVDLGQCLDDGLRRRIINLERLRQGVATAPHAGRRLLLPVHELLAERIPGYRPGDSDWERKMDALWDSLGLEAGVKRCRVKVNGHTYFIDRAVPELKIGAEYNGHEFHHLKSDRDHDAQRAAELSADGWHIIFFTDATRPETLRNSVQRIVDDRRRWMFGQPVVDQARR